MSNTYKFLMTKIVQRILFVLKLKCKIPYAVMIKLMITGLPSTAKERFPRMAKISKAGSIEDGTFNLNFIFEGFKTGLFCVLRECQPLVSVERCSDWFKSLINF